MRRTALYLLGLLGAVMLILVLFVAPRNQMASRSLIADGPTPRSDETDHDALIRRVESPHGLQVLQAPVWGSRQVMRARPRRHHSMAGERSDSWKQRLKI